MFPIEVFLKILSILRCWSIVNRWFWWIIRGPITLSVLVSYFWTHSWKPWEPFTLIQPQSGFIGKWHNQVNALPSNLTWICVAGYFLPIHQDSYATVVQAESRPGHIHRLQVQVRLAACMLPHWNVRTRLNLSGVYKQCTRCLVKHLNGKHVQNKYTCPIHVPI